MATIATSTYLDDGTARTAGEAWTINAGAVLTVRTDTRFHVGSPASMTGSIGSITCNEGEVIFDGRNVRWIAITSGSGTSAIGTTITQGGVSGYFLGYYSSLTAAPSTTVGASGFIKLREVTGGAFSSGTLTFGAGTGAATASGPDVTGWIEIVADAAANHTFPRLGKHTIRGDWFYLANTDESIGQVIDTPTNGGGSGTRVPGVWIETAASSNEYEFWPALYGSTNGWDKSHLGAAFGETDKRQNFVKDIGSGQFQIGEASDLSGTFSSVVATASTYAIIAHSCTYTVASNICTVSYPTGHLFTDGQSVGVEFTSGGASALDGIFTITVIDAYTYSFALTTSDTSGSATVRPGVTVAQASHGLGVGDVVYCDATTGTLPDGNYTIYAVTTANAFLLSVPRIATLTSGNVSVYSQYYLSYTGHGLSAGNRVYLDFTSGSGTDGLYTVLSVPDANNFYVNAVNGGTYTSGNVTIKRTIGNIPPNGCRVRIPNVILRECATATRASNSVNATIASRPEWAVSAGGYLDFEYVYTTWYANFAQAFNVRMEHSCLLDTLILTEIGTAIDIDDGGIGMNVAGDLKTLTVSSCFAGGTISNFKAHRGNTPGTTDHAIEVTYCSGISFINVDAGIIQYARSTGKAIQVTNSTNLTFSGCHVHNSDFPIVSSLDIAINNHDHCDRYIGYTNSTTAYYGISTTARCKNIVVNGFSCGYNGTIPNVHPYNTLFYSASCDSIIFKNAGTRTSQINGGTFRPNLFGCAGIFTTGGNNNILKIQRCYLTLNRIGLYTTTNSDKNTTYESVYGGRYVEGGRSIFLCLNSSLNGVDKGCSTGANSVAANTSVYGTHYNDYFLGDTVGRLLLAFNEPTADTVGLFTMVVGTARFNAAGGIMMRVVNDEAIWEDSCFRLGHTGFAKTAPTITSTTALTVTAGTWSGGVTTLTVGTHSLNVGDRVIVTGVTPAAYNGVFVITAVPLATTISYAQESTPGTWSSGGNILQLDNIDFYYALSQGSTYGNFANLKYTRTGAATTNTSTTITMTSNEGVAVGDYVTSKVAGVGLYAKVTEVNIDGVTIVVDVASTATTTSNVLYFNHLPSESVANSDIGFKMKVKAKATANCATNIVTFLRIDTISSASAQTTGLYPIDIPVTITVTVKDIVSLAAIESARVLVLADAGGPMPSNTTVTIVNSGTTATVTHTAHGLVTGDKIQIKGASHQANNGVFAITYISSSSYSYTMLSSPGSNPTGTIKATYVVISGLTNSAGVISESRYFSSNQPIIGRIRRATTGSFYKTGSIIGTIDSTSGFSSTAQMILDT